MSGGRYGEVIAGHAGMAMASVSAVIGRLKIGMMPLALTLAVQSGYGSWGGAGAIVACYVAGIGVFTPFYARIFVRYGERRTGVIATVIQLASFIGVTMMLAMRVPFPVLAAGAFVTGMAQYSIISLVRARWSRIIHDDEGKLSTAFSWESVMDDIVTVTAPVLVAVTAPIDTLVPFVLAAALTFAGSLAFFINPAGVGADWPDRTAPTGRSAGPDHAARARTAIRESAAIIRNALPAMACFLLMNAAWGAFNLAVTAMSKDGGTEWASGVIISLTAAGSIIGGLLYGARGRARRLRGYVRYQTLMAIGFAAMAISAIDPRLLPVLLAISIPASMPYAPGSVIMNVHLRHTTTDDRYIETLAWNQTFIQAGLALGNMAVGHILDATNPATGIGIAAILTLITIPSARLAFANDDTQTDAADGNELPDATAPTPRE